MYPTRCCLNTLFFFCINLITNVCLTIDLTGVGNRLSKRNLGRVGGRGRELIYSSAGTLLHFGAVDRIGGYTIVYGCVVDI